MSVTGPSHGWSRAEQGVSCRRSRSGTHNRGWNILSRKTPVCIQGQGRTGTCRWARASRSHGGNPRGCRRVRYCTAAASACLVPQARITWHPCPPRGPRQCSLSGCDGHSELGDSSVCHQERPVPHAASVGPVPPGQCTPAPTPVVTFWCPVQILENTPENHPDHSHLRQALEKAEELCSIGYIPAES